DNSIVVLEAIDTWSKKGLSAAEAALEGTREVWGAILAGTLTTVAVALPIIGWGDEGGGLLRDVAVAISVSVLLSLAVSVVAIPSFSARLLANEKASETSSLSQRAGERVRDMVGRHAEWVSRGWFRGIAITGGAVTIA